jgi:ankyrin repeat protein
MVNIREENMYYTLVMALVEGELDLAKQLLDAGVDPTGPSDQYFETVICLALTLGPDVVRMVINYGALKGCNR